MDEPAFTLKLSEIPAEIAAAIAAVRGPCRARYTRGLVQTPVPGTALVRVRELSVVTLATPDGHHHAFVW